jgi:hypothetical protein
LVDKQLKRISNAILVPKDWIFFLSQTSPGERVSPFLGALDISPPRFHSIRILQLTFVQSGLQSSFENRPQFRE